MSPLSKEHFRIKVSEVSQTQPTLLSLLKQAHDDINEELLQQQKNVKEKSAAL